MSITGKMLKDFVKEYKLETAFEKTDLHIFLKQYGLAIIINEQKKARK